MTKILFVSEMLFNIEKSLVNSIKSDIIQITNNTVPDISNLDNITHVSFLYHNDYILPFLQDNDNIKYNYFSQTAIDFINLAKTKTPTDTQLIVDLITCNLNSTDFVEQMTLMENEMNIDIRYSVDPTGNNPDGNWVLESDNVNIKDIYFTEDIDNWNGVLILYHYNSNNKPILKLQYNNGVSTGETVGEYVYNIDINGAPIDMIYDINSNLIKSNIVYNLGNKSPYTVAHIAGANSSCLVISKNGDYEQVGYFDSSHNLISPGPGLEYLDIGFGGYYTWFQTTDKTVSFYNFLANPLAAISPTSIYPTQLSSHGVNDVEKKFDTLNCLALIKTDGSLVLVTYDASLDIASYATHYPLSLTMSNIVSVSFTWTAGAALNSSGQVITWGNTSNGGSYATRYPSNSTMENIVYIVGSWSAFAALKNDGTVITWGDITKGGSYATRYSSNGNTDMINVVNIYSNKSAFTALRSDGSIVTWGDTTNGGDCSGQASEFSGETVVTIYNGTIGNDFMALTSTGKIIHWGTQLSGGTGMVPTSNNNGFEYIYSRYNGIYMAMKDNRGYIFPTNYNGSSTNRYTSSNCIKTGLGFLNGSGPVGLYLTSSGSLIRNNIFNTNTNTYLNVTDFTLDMNGDYSIIYSTTFSGGNTFSTNYNTGNYTFSSGNTYYIHPNSSVNVETWINDVGINEVDNTDIILYDDLPNANITKKFVTSAYSINIPYGNLIYKKHRFINELDKSYTFTYNGIDYTVTTIFAGSGGVEITAGGAPQGGAPQGGGGVPCLTKTCNVLTPNGYINVTKLKVGDYVVSSNDKIVPIVNIMKSNSYKMPVLLPANCLAPKVPLIDTYLSDNHKYFFNGKWFEPKYQNFMKKWKDNKIIYYHVQLPDYYKDHLIVNGLVTESWDGYDINEERPHQWILQKKGHSKIRK